MTPEQIECEVVTLKVKVATLEATNASAAVALNLAREMNMWKIGTVIGIGLALAAVIVGLVKN